MDNNFFFTIVNSIFVVIMLYIMYSIFSVIKTFFIAAKNGYDELEKKALVDAVAISMLVLMVVHLIQTIISFKIKHLYPNNLYIPVISSGAPKGVLLGNSPLHIESIFFDTFAIAIIYNINKLRYGLIDKMQFFKPFIIIFIISIIVVSTMMLPI